MFAAYRDQENRTRNCHVSNKQAPRTPGAINPKTPARFRHDENAQTLRGKVLGDAAPIQDKMMNTGAKMALRTPGPAPRTVLGNKTTNAKTGFTGAAHRGKDFEKTQAKPTTIQQQRQRAAQAAPIVFNVMEDPHEEEDPEPEYAPPSVTPVPYESDVLPRDLSMEGLKPENLMRGYHNYYHNPIDREGRSRSDRRLDAEMDKLLQKAMYENDQDLQDLKETVCRSGKAPAVDVRASSRALSLHSKTSRTEPSALRSKQAVAAPPRTTGPKILPKKKKDEAPQPVTRRPLSSLLQTKSSANRSHVAQSQPNAASKSQGFASRRTLGCNQGRATSPQVRSNTKSPAPRPASAIQPSTHRQPQFLVAFNIEDEDEDTSMQLRPLMGADDGASDDETFELKLDL